MSKITNFFNNKKVVPYLFIGFPFLLIMGLIGYPMVKAFYTSFFDWPLLAGDIKFVGLQNYINLFSDRLFKIAFKNTIIFAISYVTIGLSIGLMLALIIQYMPKRLQNFTKTVYFLPVITSMVPIAIAFKWVLGSTFNAPMNYYLSLIGIQEPIKWLTSIDFAFKSVIGVTIWKNVGFIMIIYLAGLLNIPHSYYEAAKIDGASPIAAFWHITLPLLKNTTVFLMVTGFIGSFQAITQLFVLVGGTGPAGSATVLGYEIYFRGFSMYETGSASAMGFVMFFFILIATLVQLKYFGGENTNA